MKAILEYLPRESKESFVVKAFDYAYFPTPWHYHPEYELVLVTESTGKRFIGDDIRDFGPGNLAFIGPYLPHLYRNHEEYYALQNSLRAKSIVVHFLPSSLGNDFLALPEATKLNELFERSVYGMDILGHTCTIVTEKLFEIIHLEGLKRWMKLLEILHLLSDSDEYVTISKQAIKGMHEKDNDRLNRILAWVMETYQSDITLNDAAAVVGMTPPSFSRYFKQRTRKTFTEFVTQVRLTHASKLLQEDNIGVAEICFACGFNNLSNFNRRFKEVYRMSPLSFKKQYRATYALSGLSGD